MDPSMHPSTTAEIKRILQSVNVPTDDIFERLSPRERETAERLATGQTNREIAKALKISIRTIDTHRSHLLKKLGLRGNTDLGRALLVRELRHLLDV